MLVISGPMQMTHEQWDRAVKTNMIDWDERGKPTCRGIPVVVVDSFGKRVLRWIKGKR